METQAENQPSPALKVSPVENTFEKHFDPNHQRPYYYNPFTQESLWEAPPEGATIIDKTVKQEVIDYEAHKLKMEELQRQTLESMYPEFYATKSNTNEEVLKQSELQEQAELELFKDEKGLQVHEWMQRPARRQVTELKKETAYVEGNYDYNIWYDKYLTDRNADKNEERAISLYKLVPEVDTGFTKADKMEGKSATYFCVYFARGCCSEGSNCRYYHRVPLESDLLTTQDNLRDIFGRSRHATHKENFEGVGSFNKECNTLCVSKIFLNPESEATQSLQNANGMTVKDIVRLLYEHFSPYGEIADIHFNQGRFCGYIKFVHRNFAEFAREAMHNQVLVNGVTEPIRIQWAIYDNPFDKTEAELASRDIKQTLDQNLSQRRLNDARWNLQQQNQPQANRSNQPQAGKQNPRNSNGGPAHKKRDVKHNQKKKF